LGLGRSATDWKSQCQIYSARSFKKLVVLEGKNDCGKWSSFRPFTRLIWQVMSEVLPSVLPRAAYRGCLLVAAYEHKSYLFLRVEDIEPAILRIDEALKESEKGAARIGETKSTTSNGYVAISPELEKDLRMWLQIRRMAGAYHPTAAPEPNDLLFPTETGTPYRIGNYLKRILKPLGQSAGILDLTYQALHRTFATHFQRYGSPKDAQAQLRHSKLEMTGWYMKQIPETVRAEVEKMDADICKAEAPDQERGGSIQ
jgi:hypothetical protein